MTTATSDIAAAKTTESFVLSCAALIDGSAHVSFNRGRLGALSASVLGASPMSWDAEVREPDGPLSNRVFDLCFAAANLGGFWFRGKGVGAEQWETGGSGSAAALGWINRLRDGGILPGAHWFSTQTDAPSVRREIDATLENVPYAAERRAICEEFASPEAGSRLSLFISSLAPGPTGRLEGNLGFREADILGTLFPASFGGDPFRKKAFLAVLAVVSHLHVHGHLVTADIPVPADYQLPRLLEAVGVLAFSDGILSELRSGRLIAQDCLQVEHVRAATVVACHELALLSRRPDWIVDGALFGIVRREAWFKEKAVPPMKIDGTWF